MRVLRSRSKQALGGIGVSRRLTEPPEDLTPAETVSRCSHTQNWQGVQKLDTPCTFVFFKMLRIRVLRTHPVQGLR